ncbi:glycosyltransferase family 4 protein [Pontibacter rugosus]|uniref:Glycosyltransferase family 4 protein n=1 Tax=Pontibacter rugosus TaxID=1745966 RepID=A0ABW3SVH1_9BACT
MRILLIHNYYKQAGGEDTVFHQEAALLQEHGHEVEQLTFSNNDVKTKRQKLQAALGVVHNMQSARIIKEKLEQFKPDVVHVHNFFPLVSPAVFDVCYKAGVPVVMTLHNYRLICPSALLHYNGKVQLSNVHKIFPIKPILQGVYRGSKIETASVVLTTGLHKLLGTWQKKVTKFISLTPGASDLFLHSSLKIKPDQLVVKPNFTADIGIGANVRDKYVLYIGRLTQEKGIETLLKAHTLKPFPLKIVGGGPLQEHVAAYAAANSSTVEYVGYRKREEAMELLKNAEALVFPSEWFETFGMTVVEAFSTATPVLAANIGGAAHLVQHEYNGLLYTPGNAAELREQVQKIQHNVSYARELGTNARKSYEAKYTPEVNYALLLKIYQDSIAQTQKALQ